MPRRPQHPSGARRQIAVYLSPMHLDVLDAIGATEGISRSRVLEHCLERTRVGKKIAGPAPGHVHRPGPFDNGWCPCIGGDGCTEVKGTDGEWRLR